MPIVQDWQHLTLDRVSGLPWKSADGLGILLGAPSGNLAAVDIDDKELARWAVATMIREHVYTRMVWTVSHNAHIYVREDQPSASKAIKVEWRGRTIGVELKATGTQVAAPPSPGYVLALGRAPLPVPSIGAMWAQLGAKLGVVTPSEVKRGESGGAAGFPPPWKERQAVGERNRAAFVESCQLRDSGMPIGTALQVMRVRWETQYEAGGQTWKEIEATVRSAYRRGMNQGGGLADRWKV